MVGVLYFNFYWRNFALAMSATALNFFLFSYAKKVVLDCFYVHFNSL
jgi:hypothetical protein